jgi:hypothetical protein
VHDDGIVTQGFKPINLLPDGFRNPFRALSDQHLNIIG